MFLLFVDGAWSYRPRTLLMPTYLSPVQRKKLAALARLERYEKRMDVLRGYQGGANQECIGAYVVFNNEESALRCIEDYKWVVR